MASIFRSRSERVVDKTRCCLCGAPNQLDDIRKGEDRCTRCQRLNWQVLSSAFVKKEDDSESRRNSNT